ncbi:hypothetical protein HK101_010866 [Irineochytrium annulatum]|nr:hypothetical protein HK101_010866 [Irineochytrium annulatum]
MSDSLSSHKRKCHSVENVNREPSPVGRDLDHHIAIPYVTAVNTESDFFEPEDQYDRIGVGDRGVQSSQGPVDSALLSLVGSATARSFDRSLDTPYGASIPLHVDDQATLTAVCSSGLGHGVVIDLHTQGAIARPHGCREVTEIAYDETLVPPATNGIRAPSQTFPSPISPPVADPVPISPAAEKPGNESRAQPTEGSKEDAGGIAEPSTKVNAVGVDEFGYRTNGCGWTFRVDSESRFIFIPL